MSKTITTGMLPGAVVNGIAINTSYIAASGNFGNCASRNVSYVVMHYTGNSKDTAIANAKYFHNNKNLNASAHFFVDDTSIYQAVELRDRAFHCGGTTYYHTCRNATSFGIEMCCTAGNYKMSSTTIENGAQLCAYLCKLLGITASQVDMYVLRHYDVTHKHCPAQMAGSGNAEWTAFKSRVKAILNGATVTPLTKTVQVISDDGSLNVRSGPGTSYSVIGSLSTGKPADVVGVSGNWYKINYGSGYGYISSAYTADVVLTATNTTTSKQEDDEVVQNVKMKINGSVQNVKSILKDGRNYVQLAQIGELLGLQIGYTDKTPTVDFAQLKIKIDGADHAVSGGTMVPGTSYAAVRELLELLGYEVGWDAAAKAVMVKSGGTDADSEIRSKEVG